MDANFSADDLANNAWQTLDHAPTLSGNAGVAVRQDRFVTTLTVQYGSGLRTGPSNRDHVPQDVHVDETLAYTLETGGYSIRVGVDVINMFNAHYAYRIANGFVGSSYTEPRSVFLTLSLPLAAEPRHRHPVTRFAVTL